MAPPRCLSCGQVEPALQIMPRAPELASRDFLRELVRATADLDLELVDATEARKRPLGYYLRRLGALIAAGGDGA
jgi:hypothetical protein